MALRNAVPGLLAGLPRSCWQQAGFATTAIVAKPDWKAVSAQVPEGTAKDLPTSKGGAAFTGDLRSTSGLGMGDGCKTHTDKWLQGNTKSPMQWLSEVEPIKVSGPVIASHGTDDPALGCPVEYINLRGKTKEDPAVCKYTGNRYYSDPHTWLKH
ncbi:hypothetical protein FOA52_000593 [Chlamydomonas sp. UWO 241]|nr:hypothetical protein FOA52_000593 [Chlamydomonas sp. UWO 241]